MQLAFLNQLLRKQLITDKEYSLIKNRLMKDYKVVSNLLTVNNKRKCHPQR